MKRFIVFSIVVSVLMCIASTANAQGFFRQRRAQRLANVQAVEQEFNAPQESVAQPNYVPRPQPVYTPRPQPWYPQASPYGYTPRPQPYYGGGYYGGYYGSQPYLNLDLHSGHGSFGIGGLYLNF